MADDPLALFDRWFAEARASEPNDPDAMALATADANGRPSARMVLLKSHDRDGFVFHTDGDSRKGDELAVNPRAALLFHWKSLRRQIRIEGPVAPISISKSDAYFATRPRGRQIGAWVSRQSRPLTDRATFEREIAAFAAKHEGQPIARPPRWSGHRLIPERFEFWIDRDDRLHERRLFTRATAGWEESLLYP